MIGDILRSRLVAKEFFDQTLDPDNETDAWILVRTPFPLFSILFLYLLAVLKLGPEHMKHRPPYQLKTVLRVYNVTQMAINLYLIVQVFNVSFYCIFNSYCSLEEELMKCKEYHRSVLVGGWLFTLIKTVDLLDTVFIVLKKNHVSFLHVYHHAAMVACSWISFYYFKSPQGTAQVLLNSTVHFVMYGYYWLTTFPNLKHLLWWKSHLTKLQLVQFVLLLSHLTYLSVNSCYPPFLCFLWMLNIGFICILFIKFYFDSYIKKTKIK